MAEKPLKHSQVDPYRFRDIVGSSQDLEQGILGAKAAGANSSDRVAILSDIAGLGGGVAAGVNLLSNGDFMNGFSGWEHNMPGPLGASPQEEAQCIMVSHGLCGTCGPLMGCRSLQVCLLPGCRVCCFYALRQNVCGGIHCGGEFLLIQDLCITRGEDILVPEVTLDLFVSCQYVGTKTIRLFEPPLALPDKAGITIEDGLVRLSKRIELAQCIDEVILSLRYCVIPRGAEDYYVRNRRGYRRLPGYRGFSRPACEIGEEGLEFHVGTVQLRRVTVPEREPGPISGCDINPIPIIESCHPDGRIEFTPGFGQVATMVEALEEHGASPGPLPEGPIPCTPASLFAECFTGLSGPVPVGGWANGAQGPIGTSSFDLDKLVQQAASNTFAQAQKLLGGAPPVADYTLQFRFMEAPVAPAGSRAYTVDLWGGDGKTKGTVSFQATTGSPTGSVLVRIGAGDPAPAFVGVWTQLPGSTRLVHMSVDLFGVPTLFMDGVNIPLVPAGLAVAVAGGTPNTISAITNGAGPGKPALVAKYDWLFVHLAQTPPSEVFCCPEGGPSQ